MTAARDKSKDLRLLGLSLKFSFLKTLALILLHEFFIHKIIHSLKYKRSHKPFFKNSELRKKNEGDIFVFLFHSLGGTKFLVNESVYMPRKQFSKIILLNTDQKSVNTPQPWYSEMLRYDRFFKSFWKAGAMFPKISLAANSPSHAKWLELLSFFFFL